MYSQLPPCGHPTITDTSLLRTKEKSPPETIKKYMKIDLIHWKHKYNNGLNWTIKSVLSTLSEHEIGSVVNATVTSELIRRFNFQWIPTVEIDQFNGSSRQCASFPRSTL